jgi:MoaA/NifB/PqqE/SkfB family radical SAM enzyme
MNKGQIIWSLFKQGGITPRRVSNLTRLYLSYPTKNPNVKGYPAILMIEPTNFCNLKCPLCPTGNDSLTAPKGYMDFEDYKKIIDEMGDYLLNVTLWNFGEPFLHKQISDMIDYAKKK